MFDSPSSAARVAGRNRQRRICPTQTAGGIVLPGSAAEKPNRGEVVAVGTGRVLDNGEVRAPAVKVGDKVVFGPYSGSNTVKVDGEDLLVMSENEILAVVEA